MLNYKETYSWIKKNNEAISDKDAKLVAAVMSTPGAVKRGLHKVATNAPYAALLVAITPIMLINSAVDEVKEQVMKSYEEYVKENGTQI